ncbi:hypothetical protein STSP2_02843 [Anaerohalosphaera lusitana]|uniref:AMMECR1 domain-containing protein n=1 Tax=Anaerohalosphaera lusitana TaxID=1936003 RepID=A0A1U9NP22_9BACT|nr:AmmeMemoRadiSam system protein A [Anaerohalosphaera lusitana]AQT69649.1 hypothetical protein STSP2_02843 [Anaerohalosphaera lusitana]
MDLRQKKLLLKIAKNSVESAVTGSSNEPPKVDDPDLLQQCGCFVTLKNGNQLRGCIGQFTSDKPLADLVDEMGVSASRRDPRFLTNPITPEELPELNIEISVLSPLEKTGNPLSLEIGTHGIYIISGLSSGCLLPQVAVETGWSKEEFLSYCCQYKAGLAPDAWQDPATDVYLFTAEAFDEDWQII